MYICILKFVFKGISICHPTSFLYILFFNFLGLPRTYGSVGDLDKHHPFRMVQITNSYFVK